MMDTIKYAIGQGMHQWRIAFVVYIIQLLLAMTLGMQLYQVFEASIGDSLELNRLLTSYDHTVFSDLINVHGGSIAPIIGQVRWVLLAYVVFGVFINAGLIYTVHLESNSWKDFWAGGATYFFRFFKLALINLALTGLTLVLVGIGVGYVFGKVFDFSSEKVAFFWLAVLAVILLVTLLKIFLAFLYARLSIINGGSVWSSFKTGWAIYRKHWISTWSLFLPLLLIQLVIYCIYLWIEGLSGMTSASSILIFFLIQQSIIFFRSLWKLMIYNGLLQVYNKVVG